MRNIAVLLATLFVCIGIAFSQQPPPGADQVGSDKTLQKGDNAQRPTNDPRVNGVITGTIGTTNGVESTPALAGEEGSGSRTNTQTPDAAGQSRETGVAAARRSAGQRSAEQNGGLKPGDNGSVWNSNTTRDSNIVQKMNNRQGNETQSHKKKK